MAEPAGKPIWEVAADIADKVPQEEWDKMTKPTKCKCRTGYESEDKDPDHSFPIVIRCDWCNKRDEVWPELVDWLEKTKNKYDYTYATGLLARAKEVT